jgi:penicillin amidase
LKELAQKSLAQIDGELQVPGLQRGVQVIRDSWGVPHIYAETVDDLFFSQGYVTAQDRLWQMEWWRRGNEGRLAEVLGPEMAEADRLARLLKYRGPTDDTEWSSYHPDGKRIMTAYVNGINAFIAQNAGNLPVEFKLTGIRPEPWTIETVVLREVAGVSSTPGWGGFGDAPIELLLARNVAQLGAEEANRRAAPDPWDDLKVPNGLDVSVIGEDIFASMGRVGGRLPRAPRPEILPQYRQFVSQTSAFAQVERVEQLGSNNWVISGALSATGRPMVVNDPHREVTHPSLRYNIHLNGPGWNVVGSGEPPFIGVALGHNDRIAWGFTILGTDQQDVFVEEVNPANPNEVRYNSVWEPLRIVREEIKVKGEAPRIVELKFSRHGPIFHEDNANHRAYALKSVLNEPGTAFYMGSLRLAQARNCREFLDAGAKYWKAPSHNLICGDVEGNIAWQASGMAPIRSGSLGRLPVPGTGQYEWQGFRSDLPNEFNPSRGFKATANDYTVPREYRPPLMFKTTNDLQFARITRLQQVLVPGRKYSIEDHKRMQHDSYSLRAAADQPAFRGWTAKSPEVERARTMLSNWNGYLTKESAEAAIYQTWRSVADQRALSDRTPRAEREPLIETGLAKAIEALTETQGADWKQWRWGRMHTRTFPHPLVADFDLPTVERSGGAGTVEADGATYRQIIDVADWDRSLTVNVPGASAQPESPFYGNLLRIWANNEYFPMLYSRRAVDANASHRLKLTPAGRQATQ